MEDMAIPHKVILRDYCLECMCFRDHLVKHSGTRITYTCFVCKLLYTVPNNALYRNAHRRYILLHGRTLYTEQVVYDKEGAYYYPCPVEMTAGTGEGGLGIATLPDAGALLVVRILNGPANYWSEYVRAEPQEIRFPKTNIDGEIETGQISYLRLVNDGTV